MNTEYTSRLEAELNRAFAGAGKSRKDASEARKLADAAVETAQAARDSAVALEQKANARYLAMKARLGKLKRMRHDPAVLVRVIGPNVTRYHDADEPCGWVRDPDRYERWLWGEAKAAGYEPCTSCGFRADRRAKAA